MVNKDLEIQVFGDINFSSLTTEKIEKLVFDFKEGLPNTDIRIGNLECPILQDNSLPPIPKTGKHWYSDKSMVEFLKKLDITAVTLANNHIGDYSVLGVESTITVLQEASIEYIGAGMNINEAYAALHLSVRNISVSIISVCENEFGVASEEGAGVAGFNVRFLAKRIKEEKEISNHVIVIMHGGNEYNPLPSPEVTERYKFIIDLGATAVIGMHTHCPQGYEYYNGGLIVYSVGNFFFPNEDFKNSYSTWYEGYVAHLSISKNEIILKTIPYRYSPAEEKLLLLSGNDMEVFQQYLNQLNEIIMDKKELREYFVAWSVHKGEKYASRLNWRAGCDNLNELMQKCLQIQNLFRCEAHREVMQSYFETTLKLEEKYKEEYWEYLKNLFFIPISIKKQQKELEHFYDSINLKNKIEILEFVANGGNIYICGAGKCGITLYLLLIKNKQSVKLFLENNQQREGEYICNVRIETYGIVKRVYNKKDKYIVAIINKEVQKMVKQQLINLGVTASQILLCRNEE